MEELRIENIKNEYILPNLILDEKLIGFCSAQSKPNMLKYFLQSCFAKSQLSTFWIAITDKGVHLHEIDFNQTSQTNTFHNWENIIDITYRFAGTQASFSFIPNNQNKHKFILHLNEKNNQISLDKKAIVFLMRKTSNGN